MIRPCVNSYMLHVYASTLLIQNCLPKNPRTLTIYTPVATSHKGTNGRAGQFKLCLTRIYSLSLHLLSDYIRDTPHVRYTLHINYIHTCSYLTQRKKGEGQTVQVICLTRIYSLSLHLLPDYIRDTPHVKYTLHINYIHTCSYLTQRKKGEGQTVQVIQGHMLN